ncbi:MAG: aspartate-semialdehyde dehydrogenase [Thermosediminibacterales bacterium]|nr:aspartate-semialdehyde dehydrogenase [Thermosediminibacterales bacterium]MDK2836092.1 aspartate-semialdehyde dehydrogenase [Thermosediminibacterales bacterium]
MKKYNFGIVGATGAVGQQVLKVLEERNFPVAGLKPMASDRSAGKEVTFKGKPYKVIEATPEAFDGLDMVIFSAGTEVSRRLAPECAKRGAVVIDNSNAFRMNENVPLVVPEVNPEEVKKHNGIIANPNCSTIQMVVALKPLHDYAKIKRIVVSTYQAVSGTGLAAMEELKIQSKALLTGDEIKIEVYPHQIAFNVLPHIDVFDDMGYTKEEMKMVNETKKILNDYTIKVTATTVRVPVLIGHSESVNIETEKKITRSKAHELLSKAPGVILQDDPYNNVYPLPANVAGRNEVFVGRVREDYSIENGLNLWVVADNLRKGAAFNAVQIAELLIKYKIV